ncbi:protein kinase [Nocardioides sp. CBS4Y-1]|uniref:Protein kinase n=1 Tax=Nocardioides acrostichi TaxID=2784339 RepID=A0A930UZL9_9ACTN|nr:protein kinase [Nocardioides acrostichi]
MEAVPPPEGRVDERVLTLPFECLRSLPEGINEVHVWSDPLLGCERVGKRIDMSAMEGDDVLPEPATLQSIRHNNVVPVVAAAEVSGYPQPMRVVEVITPYFERGSITDALLRGEKFTARTAVAITQATLRGLSEVHEVHGICHRDVKSGNVLLCPDHVARLADLGLCGRFDDNGEVLALKNPTLYSSPEFTATSTLTRASDVYSVGLILRELLGGPFPYADYTTTFVLERMSAGRSPLRAADLSLPIWASRSMRRVYTKATHRDPARRYQSAHEMDQALSRVVAVDWEQISENRWEAPFVHSSKRVAVEATWMPRKKLFRVSSLASTKSGWRRTQDDVEVDDLGSTAVARVFNHASDTANAR